MPKRSFRRKGKGPMKKRKKSNGKRRKDDEIYYETMGKRREEEEEDDDDDGDDNGSESDASDNDNGNENSVWNIYKHEDDEKEKKIDPYNKLIQSLMVRVGSSLPKEKRTLIKQVQEEKGFEMISDDSEEDEEISGGENENDEENEEDEEDAQDDVSDEDADGSGDDNNDDDDEKDEQEEEEEENDDDDGQESKRRRDVFGNTDKEDEDDEENDDSDEAKLDNVKENDPYSDRFMKQKVIDDDEVKKLHQTLQYTKRSHTDIGHLTLCDEDSEMVGTQKIPLVLSACGKGNINKQVYESVTSIGYQHFIRPKLLERWNDYNKARELSNHVSDDYPNDKYGFSEIHNTLLPLMLGYYDIYFTARTIHNAPMIRQSYVLHVLNHVLKAVRITKNNTRKIKAARIEEGKKKRATIVEQVLKQEEGNGKGKKSKASKISELKFENQVDKLSKLEEECKDQGFARAKVLIIVPYRNQAFRIAKLMVELLSKKVMKPHYEEFVSRYGTGDEALDDLPSSSSFDETDFAKNRHPLQTQKPEKGERVIKRPSDWYSSFEGNSDESFCLGLTIGSESFICFGTDLYSCDVIIASPLGLRVEIGHGVREGFSGITDRDNDKNRRVGGMKDGKPITEADAAAFLSSIEMCIVDEADAFEMQNRQHLIDLFGVLNRFPTTPRAETDFSRVYPHVLAKQSLYFRQTMIFSAYPEAYMNALALRGMASKNYMGVVNISPAEYEGTPSLNVASNGKYMQRFVKVSKIDDDLPSDSVKLIPNANDDIDEIRFEFFKKKVMPSLEDPETSAGTLLFVPSYLDFVKVRNFFRKRAEELADLEIGAIARIKKQEKEKKESERLKDKLSEKAQKRRMRKQKSNEMFASISEYTSYEDVSFARNEFFHQRTRVLIVTERWMYYNRFRLRGVQKVVMYGPPIHANFYEEMILNIEENQQSKKSQSKKIPIVVLLSPLQHSLELQRIIGTQKAIRFLTDEKKFSLTI